MAKARSVIAIFDAHEADQAYFKAALSQDYDLKMTAEPLGVATAQLAAQAEVVSVHVASQVSKDVMRRLPSLRHVACRTTGFDNVDLPYAAAHNITVSTIPGYGDATVAEYAFLLLLAVMRRLMLSAHSVHAGTVTPEKLTGHELAGKTLGVIGTGRIGRHAAMIGRGFGMTVAAYDPHPDAAAARDIGYQNVPLPELLARADAITLHAPAVPATHHLLDADTLAQAKPGVFIVNTARGSLIDTPALIQALQSGRVAGAGLDVLEGEEYLQRASEVSLLARHELDQAARQVLGIDILHKMPQVLITSHNAYNSAEALERIRHTTVANIRAWAQGQPQNIVKS